MVRPDVKKRTSSRIKMQQIVAKQKTGKSVNGKENQSQNSEKSVVPPSVTKKVSKTRLKNVTAQLGKNTEKENKSSKSFKPALVTTRKRSANRQNESFVKRVTPKFSRKTKSKVTNIQKRSTQSPKQRANVGEIGTNSSSSCTPQGKIQFGIKTDKKSSGLRQMSLKESFSNQPVSKRLRPRTTKNYCDDSKLIKKFLPSGQQNSLVVVEKTQQTKKPIYKSTFVHEENMKNENDVYAFNFDDNDSTERIRKRKKKVTKKAPKKSEKKTVSKKSTKKNTASTNAVKKTVVVPSLEEKPELIQQKETLNIEKPIENKCVTFSNEDTVRVINTEQSEDTNKENIEQETSFTEANTIHLPQNAAKPTIVSVENLSNKKVVMARTPLQEKAPFQQTNVRDNKHIAPQRNVNDSLFSKSLSPILKSVQSFDAGSPWRPPPVYPVSHAKVFFQSTPYNAKVNVLSSKNFNIPSNGTKIFAKSESQHDVSEKNNENVHPSSIANKNTPIKNSLVLQPRKFGTEITNIENSTPQTVDNANGERTERIVIEPEPVLLSQHASDNNLANLSAYNSDAENKENAVPNYQTPRKPLIKKVKRKVALDQKENFDPQPGPSGLQKPKVLQINKVLRQSNLNSFLNLTEFPESTKINTGRGIFDDAHSTPINGKPLRKIPNVKSTDIENAFGFTDSESNLDVSPINTEVPSSECVQEQNVQNARKPFRLALPGKQMDVKVAKESNKLKREIPLVIQGKVSKEEDEKSITANLKNKHEVQDEYQKKALINAVDFSDTFDMLSEQEKTVEDMPEIPLFADLEPVHFKEPPRYSYKRKRGVKFDLEEDTASSEEEADENGKHKKKRRAPMNKETTKRLNKWVEDVNRTFEEIDQYDLIIE